MGVGEGGGLPEDYFDDDRPQFHIQPPAGWMNDPNGPIYYKGRYHMYVYWSLWLHEGRRGVGYFNTRVVGYSIPLTDGCIASQVLSVPTRCM